MKKAIILICILAMLMAMAACAAPQQPQDIRPSETAPIVHETTAPDVNPQDPPSVPEEPEVETPIIPQEPEVETPVIPQEPEVETPVVPQEPEVETPVIPQEPEVETPIIPQEPEVETPVVPQEPQPPAQPEKPVNPPKPAEPPKEDPLPAGCPHKNTEFVPDYEPPTCLDYGYISATICTDCKQVISYRDRYSYIDDETGMMPTRHLSVIEGWGSIESTPVKEGYSGDTVCLLCDAVLATGHSLPLAPYFVGFEVISESRPNAVMADGTDMLTRMFGPHKAYQPGDSVTFRIVMSDGGTTGFELSPWQDESGVIYTLEENILTVTFTDGYTGGWMHSCYVFIHTVNKYGVQIGVGAGAETFINYEGDLSKLVGKGEYTMDLLLRAFAGRNGVYFTTDRQSVPNYTNEDPTLSIHGTTSAYFSDVIPITGNSDWLSQVLAVIEEYGRRGYNLAHWEPLESGNFSCRVGYSQEVFALLEQEARSLIERYGFHLVSNPADAPSYTEQDLSMSLTGTADGYYDDIIMITGNPGWYYQLLDLLYDYTWYNEPTMIPLNTVYLSPFADGRICLRAGYDPSLA